MHTLFNIDLNIQTPVFRHPDWGWVSETVRRGLNSFTEYYHSNSTAIKSNHLLVKLIQSITVPKSQSLNSYYEHVDLMSSNLSMALKFTSSINKGNIFNNVFYGQNSNEIIISYSAPFDLEFADKNWKDASAVRVLRHDRSSLALTPLVGLENYNKKEIAIIAINIPLLAVQYRAFRNHESTVNQDDSQRSVMQFIAMYVLPNMQASHLDHCIFNRLYNLLFNLPNDEFIVKTPFYQTDYSKRIDKMLEDYLERFKSTKLRFDGILRTIPMVSYDNAFELMKIPKVLPTRQVLWALITARIKALDFLFSINEYSQTAENQSNMNRIIRQAIFYRSDTTLQYGLTPEIYLDVQSTIDRLESIAKQ